MIRNALSGLGTMRRHRQDLTNGKQGDMRLTILDARVLQEERNATAGSGTKMQCIAASMCCLA